MDYISRRNLTLSLLIRTIKVLIFLVKMKGEQFKVINILCQARHDWELLPLFR